MLKSGMKSLFTVAKNSVNGVDQMVDEPTKIDRLNECNMCDKLLITRQCKECLCFIDLKTKLKQEKCPLNKWLSQE